MCVFPAHRIWCAFTGDDDSSPELLRISIDTNPADADKYNGLIVATLHQDKESKDWVVSAKRNKTMGSMSEMTELVKQTLVNSKKRK